MPIGVYERKPFSEEHKRNMSEAKKEAWRLGRIKGHPCSEEAKRNISIARLKRKKRLGYINSPETRKIMSKIRRGKKHPEEHKEYIRRIAKERHFGKWMKGRKLSEKTKWKLSEALKRKGTQPPSRLGMKYSEEHKQNISKALTGKKRPPLTEKHKRNLSEALRGEKSPAWQGGISFYPYPTYWTGDLKRAVRKRDKYTCQLCGKEPATFVHHIDYDKKNCNLDNLITLCKSCHSKTNHNRKYWELFFRRRG